MIQKMSPLLLGQNFLRVLSPVRHFVFKREKLSRKKFTSLFDGRSENGIQAYTGHLFQNWLWENLDIFWSKEFWPSKMADLNPLDSSLIAYSPKGHQQIETLQFDVI